jgi:hypothetical protein
MLTEGDIDIDDGGGEVGEKDLSPAGAYLSWNNLDYSVQIRKGLKKHDLQLLHGVHGYVKPGMMLALMVCEQCIYIYMLIITHMYAADIIIH